VLGETNNDANPIVRPNCLTIRGRSMHQASQVALPPNRMPMRCAHPLPERARSQT
jgi:hypothetical protein